MRMSAALTCLLFVARSLIAGQSELGLRAIVVEGNGARYVIEQIPPTPIVIRVVDRNNRAVSGATVLFTAPENGPSGDFANGLSSFSTFTNEEGLATAPQFHPNNIEGNYQISIRAQYANEIALASIRQTNVAAKKSVTKKLVILSVAGALAGVAVVSRN